MGQPLPQSSYQFELTESGSIELQFDMGQGGYPWVSLVGPGGELFNQSINSYNRNHQTLTLAAWAPKGIYQLFFNNIAPVKTLDFVVSSEPIAVANTVTNYTESLDNLSITAPTTWSHDFNSSTQTADMAFSVDQDMDWVFDANSERQWRIVNEAGDTIYTGQSGDIVHLTMGNYHLMVDESRFIDTPWNPQPADSIDLTLIPSSLATALSNDEPVVVDSETVKLFKLTNSEQGSYEVRISHTTQEVSADETNISSTTYSRNLDRYLTNGINQGWSFITNPLGETYVYLTQDATTQYSEMGPIVETWENAAISLVRLQETTIDAPNSINIAEPFTVVGSDTSYQITPEKSGLLFTQTQFPNDRNHISTQIIAGWGEKNLNQEPPRFSLVSVSAGQTSTINIGNRTGQPQTLTFLNSADAPLILLDEPVSLTIDTDKNLALYNFDIQDNQTFSIEEIAGSGSNNTYSLYDKDGNFLFESRTGNLSDSPIAQKTLKAGRYTLAISRTQQETGLSDGKVALQIHSSMVEIPQTQNAGSIATEQATVFAPVDLTAGQTKQIYFNVEQDGLYQLDILGEQPVNYQITAPIYPKPLPIYHGEMVMARSVVPTPLDASGTLSQGMTASVIYLKKGEYRIDLQSEVANQVNITTTPMPSMATAITANTPVTLSLDDTHNSQWLVYDNTRSDWLNFVQSSTVENLDNPVLTVSVYDETGNLLTQTSNLTDNGVPTYPTKLYINLVATTPLETTLEINNTPQDIQPIAISQDQSQHWEAPTQSYQFTLDTAGLVILRANGYNWQQRITLNGKQGDGIITQEAAYLNRPIWLPAGSYQADFTYGDNPIVFEVVSATNTQAIDSNKPTAIHFDQNQAYQMVKVNLDSQQVNFIHGLDSSGIGNIQVYDKFGQYVASLSNNSTNYQQITTRYSGEYYLYITRNQTDTEQTLNLEVDSYAQHTTQPLTLSAPTAVTFVGNNQVADYTFSMADDGYLNLTNANNYYDWYQGYGSRLNITILDSYGNRVDSINNSSWYNNNQIIRLTKGDYTLRVMPQPGYFSVPTTLNVTAVISQASTYSLSTTQPVSLTYNNIPQRFAMDLVAGERYSVDISSSSNYYSSNDISTQLYLDGTVIQSTTLNSYYSKP